MDQPLNLAPIRAAVHTWKTGSASSGPSIAQHVRDDTFARYASTTIPALCDEIVRLRAALADTQVVQP